MEVKRREKTGSVVKIRSIVIKYRFFNTVLG